VEVNEIPLPNINYKLITVSVTDGLDDRGSSIRLPTGAGNFSLHHRVQNGPEAHPASYPVGDRDSFPGDKATGA
jgi:hypothetical protein